jgi:hypothetical protein
MASKESWRQVAKKLQKWLENDPAKIASKRESELTSDSVPQKEISVAIAKAKKADWLNIREVLELIQHELDVSQFAARETVVKACGSGKIPVRYVRPKGGEDVFYFIDPRWWRPNLAGMKIGREFFEHGEAEFEITASELSSFFIDVQALLRWLTDRGYTAKRGNLQWYPIIGDYGPVSRSHFDQNDIPSMPGSLAASSEDNGTRSLPGASNSMIDEAISDVYSESERARQKPPNIKEIVLLVQAKLAAKGYAASGRQIQSLADADKYKKRRRKPGRTLANEKRRQ